MTNQKRVLAAPGVIESYPVLPLRDIVVFPHMIVPLFVGREKSIKALEEVMDRNNPFNKVTIIRSSVQSRDMGFLPGDVDEKMDVYIQPYRQICSDLFKRKDAYHEIDTIMVETPFTDVLEITPAEQDEFIQTGIEVPSDGTPNLCQKALNRLRLEKEIPPVRIHLRKQIPVDRKSVV